MQHDQRSVVDHSTSQASQRQQTHRKSAQSAGFGENTASQEERGGRRTPLLRGHLLRGRGAQEQETLPIQAEPTTGPGVALIASLVSLPPSPSACQHSQATIQVLSATGKNRPTLGRHAALLGR